MDDPADEASESDKIGPERDKEVDTLEQEEAIMSEASISEHITSEGSSVENDRSFQEIEILNQPSNTKSVSNISQEPQPNSLDLSSFDNTLTNGLPDNTNKPLQEPHTSGTNNAKSILEEILNNSQFNSTIDLTNSKEDSFNMFANLDLSDKSLINLPEATFDLMNMKESKVKLPEEVATVKVQDLDSFREMSNPTYTSSMISATEYRQLQEECHSKLMEYNSAIIYKNDLIQKLSESLDQAANERKELLAQVETFKEEIAQLQNTVRETSKMVEEHQCDTQNGEATKLHEELVELKEKMVQNKEEYETELTRLRNLLENIKCGSTELMDLKEELERKHTTEVEELRTYFEKKCVELEKNYSEEIFSQQSRKMSGTSSEADLSGDFLLSSQPGPGGDCETNIFNTKEDVERFKEILANFSQKLAKHCLEDIGDKGLRNIEIEVRTELNGLLKIGEKLELDEVRRSGVCVVRSTVQEVANSGDFELTELVESYERRLQQQIHLAKFDLINELESQIQRLASSETDIDEDWPSELLQLRDKFADKYKKEIEELQEKHNNELTKLKDEHLKILNGALERARRRSLKDGDSLSKSEIEILKERDSLKRQVVSLRNLLTELVQYFAQAEDELNNTLVDNLLNRNSCTDPIIEDDVNLDASSGATTNSSRVFDSFNKTRVHLAPNFGDLIDMVEHHSHNESLDISVDLKNELGMRLEQLRQEANAVLALTQKDQKEGVNLAMQKENGEEEVLSGQLVLEREQRERLQSELAESNALITSLEKEKEALEQRLDDLLDKIGMLEADLEQSRYKISELVESGRRSEVVSEGYGEEGQPTLGGLEDTMKTLSELQEKARTMLAHTRSSADPNVLQLIEELCRVGEKIKEEANRESQDLLQQIDVADKKYKTTQQFLEEQAAEREQERDEAQRKIDKLYEQLKERDKDRANCEVMSCEPGQHRVKFSGRQLDVDASQAEQLEQQIQELTNLLTEQQRTNTTLKEELEEAVEKLKIFRDIIQELEQRGEAKDREVEQLLRNVEKLECIVRQQNLSLDETKFNHSLGGVTDIRELRRRCEELEEEVQKLRIGAELAGSEGALKQINLQLLEIETNLDKKTKELELLHSTGTNCSSPSEDMSVRDLVQPQTLQDDCEIPLQQLARLKEKLMRHSRAEEAAIKRIRDLEMQVDNLKTDLEEATNEKDFLKKQTHEQLVLISDFQIRLDEQRVKAEFIEKQTNTSLEIRIHELQSENFELQDKLKNKDKLVQHQEKVIKETQQRVLDLEREIASGKDDDVIIEMQKDLDALRHENALLKTRASTDNQILPNLVENIIQDKNNELDKLREKLTNTEKLLYNYTSLNLDKSDLKTLANLKNSGGSIEHLISILDLSRPEQIRKYERSRNADLSIAGHPLGFKRSEETQFLGSGSEQEISEIERVGPSNLNYTCVAPLGKPNSTELGHKSTEKRVHFEDTVNAEKLLGEIETLRREIDLRDQQILELQTKLKILNEFENNITDLQGRLDKTEEALTKTTDVFKQEQRDSIEKEQKMAVELAGKNVQLNELEKEVQTLREDSVRKDKMYFNLAKEKRDLEQKFEAELKEKGEALERQIVELRESEEKMAVALQKVERLEQDNARLKNNLTASDEENSKLRKEFENYASQASMELEQLRQDITDKENALKSLKKELLDKEIIINALKDEMKKKDALVIDKDCDLEIMNEDLKYYQNHLTEMENKLKSIEEGDKRQEEKLRVSELTKELAKAQELARERERVIAQMVEDYNQVQSNMKVINTKMKETGNVVDLSNRLKAEQKKTADLHVEIQTLKASLMNYELANAAPVDAITGQLKRELECAAQIDSNILSAISDQSLSSISEGHDVEVYMKSLSRQKSQNKQLLRQIDQIEKQKLTLEQQFNVLQQKLIQLQNYLEKEKMASKQALIEDAKLIEQLRIQLDGALDYREHLEKLLEQEKLAKKALELQCEDLKKPCSSSESTKYKSLPSQNALELTQLKKELEQVKLEKEELLREIKGLRQRNGQLESNVKYTKEMLDLSEERNRNQEEKFRVLSEKERSLSEELFRRKFELELKGRELEEKKVRVDELEQEKSLLKKQKSDLLKALKSQSAAIPSQENAIIPETLEKVIQELKSTSEDNKRKLEYIERIESEKRLLEQQLRNEMRSNVNDNVPFADLVARCNYLFAKALKLESVKKALVWQKRYLVDFLQSHQRHCLIEVLPSQPHVNYCLRRRHSPLQHFRAAVCAVIAIERMKFLVRRWHTGMRKYERINARHFQRSREKYLQENPGGGATITTANFQVGQPVSTQNFSPNPFRTNHSNPFHRDALAEDSRPDSPAFSVASAIRDAPWSGHSPPCKENDRNKPFGLQHLGNIPALQAPQLLSQLHERVELIQEKLNLPFTADHT
ncbi:centrosomal protein of 290 kDa-like isoform X2 [Anthonomus grandis grandis]|uniref:centrosomal protein of 290 kDa-like isoform X2 n=1 Tax=Anthonomus grandis grandis TaxID=2921223 RepID=UPI00216520E2|nr:centrosomal protein of 290 kDa-like isoform X2 [Anthonomus grandis grandis]